MNLEFLLNFSTILIAFLLIYVALIQINSQIRQEIKEIRDDLKITNTKINTLLMALYSRGIACYPPPDDENGGKQEQIYRN